jgi:hypothetical protein
LQLGGPQQLPQLPGSLGEPRQLTGPPNPIPGVNPPPPGMVSGMPTGASTPDPAVLNEANIGGGMRPPPEVPFRGGQAPGPRMPTRVRPPRLTLR